ncbi:MAG: hypothetical protein IJP13_04605 [Lachnospiraceae bacterium]|nr:hypothetical protein [Lachnospiraceae bacterium]
MSEFLRIFKDKKRISFLLGLFLLNLIFILKDNWAAIDVSNAYEKAIKEYQSMDIDEAYEQNKINVDKYYEEAWSYATDSEEQAAALKKAFTHEKVTPSIEHIRKYADKYQGMLDNASRMITFGLVGGKETFAYQNIRKTLIDFADIEGLDVKLENDKTVNAFLEFEMTDYMIILAILLIVASFVEEQKKGLFFIIRSCAGRNKLVFTRQIVLFLSSFFISLAFYGSTYVTFGLIHGFAPMDTLVQCFPVFDNCYTIMSIGTFVAVMILLKTIVLYMIGNLFWFMLNLFNNMLTSVGIMSVFFVLEYIAYNSTIEGNIYDILKYFNIFNYISIEETYIHYLNIDVLGKCVGILTFSIATLLLSTVAFTVIATVLAVNKRYTPSKSLRLVEIVRKKLSVISFAGHTSLARHEAYRFFKCNGVLVIMIVFGIFMYMSYEKPRPEYDQVQVYVNEHYSFVEGKLDETTDAYLIEQRKQLEKEKEELAAYVEENPDYASTQGYIYAEENLRVREEALNIMDGENVRLRQLKAEGHDVCFVNYVGYRNIFMVSSISTYVSYLIPIFFVVLCVATVFSYDNEYNLGRFLKATPRGRQPVLRLRVTYAIISTVIVWAVMNIIELYKVHTTYGLHQLGTEAASVNIFVGATSHMSIITVLILLYATRLVVLICVALVAMWISSMLQSNKISYVINLVALILPAAFVTIGAELFGWISYIDIYKAHSNVSDLVAGNYIAVIPYLICVATGVASYMRLRKKMCA